MDTLSVSQKHYSTPIKTNEIIQDIADFFQLGKVVSTRKSNKGLANSSFFVATEDGQRYVIRLLDAWDSSIFENEHFVQNNLLDSDVVTSHMIMSESNEYVYLDNDVRATVTKAIYGVHPQNPIPLEICHQIGKTMSRFHTLLANKGLPNVNPESFMDPQAINSRLERLMPGEYQTGARKLLDASFISYDEQIPSGIIHSDLHVDNLIIDSNQDIVVLDLQNVGIAPYIIDIGRSIADVCSYSNYLDPEKVAGFIAGYEENRVLTVKEKELLGKSIGYGAIATGIWFYEFGDYAFANHFYDVSSMAQSIITP